MLNFVKALVTLNSAMAEKVRSITAYDEALAFHGRREYANALPLMFEAAQLGNPQAMSLLGSMYLLGQGVKENGSEATKWLLAAVDAGFDEAGSVLGMAYATGKAGVPVDHPKARRLLEIAAAKGDTQSARMLEMMEKGEGIFKKASRAHRR